ncbi:hypothetical protein Drorol1_Dr00025067 [Drosera rotundifolia]
MAAATANSPPPNSPPPLPPPPPSAPSFNRSFNPGFLSCSSPWKSLKLGADLRVRAVSSSSVIKGRETLDFETSVFVKEKITLAGRDEGGAEEVMEEDENRWPPWLKPLLREKYQVFVRGRIPVWREGGRGPNGPVIGRGKWVGLSPAQILAKVKCIIGLFLSICQILQMARAKSIPLNLPLGSYS